METIDNINIRLYLESGYQLTINKMRFKEQYCSLLVFFSGSSICDLREVEVNSLISPFPNICKEIGGYQSLIVTYDRKNWSIKSWIQVKTFDGPYCEEVSYELVEGYEGYGLDVMSSLSQLDENILNHKKQNTGGFLHKSIEF